MAFCAHCGRRISDGINNCPFCGKPVNASSPSGGKENRFDKFYDESYYSIDSDNKKSKKRKKEKPVQAYYSAPQSYANTQAYNNPQPASTAEETNGTLFASLAIFLFSIFGSCFGFGVGMPVIPIVVAAGLMVLIIYGLRKFKGKVFLIFALIPTVTVLIANVIYSVVFGLFTVAQHYDGRDPILNEAGVYVPTPEDGGKKVTVYYYFAITNLDDTYVLQNQGVSLHFVNSSGKRVGIDIPRVEYVMPGDTVYVFGTETGYGDHLGECVDVEAEIRSNHFVDEERIATPVYSDEIEIWDIDVTEEKHSLNVTGSVTNDSDYKLTKPEVYVVFFCDDEIVAIDYGTISSLNPGETDDFEIKVYQDIPEYDTVECYLNIWAED